MKLTFRLLFVFSALSIALAGCATKPTSSASESQNEAGETASKAAEPVASTCKSVAETGNNTAPPEIYDEMRQCALDGNYENGVALFSLAGTYSFYDALRVEDPSAFSVRDQLPHDSVEALGTSLKTNFLAAARTSLGDEEKLASICKEVMRVGPPNYYPAYMVLHGEDGAEMVKKKGGLSTPFDSKTAWNQALNRFLHCSRR